MGVTKKGGVFGSGSLLGSLDTVQHNIFGKKFIFKITYLLSGVANSCFFRRIFISCRVVDQGLLSRAKSF